MDSKQNRLKKKLNVVKSEIVKKALKRNSWRLVSAAKSLGMPMSTLQSIIKGDTKLLRAYARYGHSRGRPPGKRKAV